MVKRIGYYKGCSLEGLASEYDHSVIAVCEALGLELFEIPDWSCCGSTPAHSYDPLLSAALAGRNLAIAEREGCEVLMTPCPGCLKSLKGGLEAYNNPEEREAFLDVLGMDFQGGVKAVSVVQLLYETIGPAAVQAGVKNPMTGRVVVPYYGCLLSRPPKIAKFDDPENPISMDRLLEASGATVPDFPYKTECCGATLGVTRNEIVGKLGGRILDMAKRLGADAVAVACPLCQQNLDLRQDQIASHSKHPFNIPIMYITQIIGLALGIDSSRLGLNKLFVSPELFVNKAVVQEKAAVSPDLKAQSSPDSQA